MALLRGGGDFQRELRAAVGEVLTAPVLRRGRWAMGTKAALITAWAIASYLGLILWAREPWIIAPLCISLALALAGVGFYIQHDTNHGAAGGRLARLYGFSLDLMGGSSHVWRE